MTAADLVPASREGVPDVEWKDSEDLAALRKRHARAEVCAALERIEAAGRTDKKITSELDEVRSVVGGEFHGLAHRVKSPSSLTRKINKDVLDAAKSEQDLHPADAAAKLNDVQRYTFVHADHDSLTEKARQTGQQMRARGWTLTKVKNTYQEGSTYKGLHIIAKDSDGTPVEVQIHSELSQRVKDESHQLYEVVRDINASDKERAEAAQRGKSLYEDVPTPRGMDDLTEVGGCPVVRK